MKATIRFSFPDGLAATAWTFGAVGCGYAHASGEPLLGLAGATAALIGSAALRVLSDRREQRAYDEGVRHMACEARLAVREVLQDRRAA